MGSAVLRLAMIVAAWLALVAPAAAVAQARLGIVGAPVAVCLKPVAAQDDPIRLFHQPSRFDCMTEQRRFGPGDFWALSEPIRVGGKWPAHIRTVSLWQESATLYARYADGVVLRLPGDGRAISRSLQLGAIVEFRLPARSTPVARLLWRIDGAANMRGVLLDVRSARPSESAKSNIALASLYSAFAGLCLALLLYNVAIYGALRHPFQLAYCVMVLALLLYAFSNSGAMAWAFPEMANNTRLRFNYVGLAASATAALVFARLYFEPRVFAGWLGRAVPLACAGVIGSALLCVAVAPWQVKLLDRLYAISYIPLLGLAAPILWRAWRTSSQYLWLFALAWAGPIALASVRIANNFGLIPYSFLVDNSTLLAMALEALLCSLAIAYRLRLLSIERDQAREQELLARLLANTDPLTGLLNRRAFLQQAIGRPGAQRLLLLDIDHFKHVNETIGHDGGDEVLRVVARTLRGATPDGGLVARLGGEEFACLCDADQAPAPETVLEGLRAARMPYDITVTSSVGVCTGALARETDWKTLYRRADQALFAAKAAGRDRARDAALLAA